MNRASRFLVLLKLEESKEREEAKRLADSQRLLQERRKKLTELQAYLGEYHQQFSLTMRAGTTARQIQSSHAFINRLNGGIDQQGMAIEEAEYLVEECRQSWLEAKKRVDILNKTIERLEQEEVVRENRREQIQADEIAQHKFHRQ